MQHLYIVKQILYSTTQSFHWYNSGTNRIGAFNHILIDPMTYSIQWNLCLFIRAKNLWICRSKALGKNRLLLC